MDTEDKILQAVRDMESGMNARFYRADADIAEIKEHLIVVHNNAVKLWDQIAEDHAEIVALKEM